MDAWMLGAEASTVMALRMTKLALGGDPGGREATLMVAEKIKAAAELQASLFADGMSLTPLSGTQKALRHYRAKVAANRRRLSRG
ncbi:hypothetical protein [Sphingomonas sp.]|uniref:hypothetical protein n=1 Tax=Sphingomonas sp. TaxID=28214 RepID=UPI003CC51053